MSANVRHVSENSLGFSTLVDVLRCRARDQPDQKSYSFLADGETETHLTYRELDRQARAIGAQLQALGGQNTPVLLFYRPGLEFIAAYFGCLYAGAVAVPVPPPPSNRVMPQLQAIVADAQATIALTTRSKLARIEGRIAPDPGAVPLQWLASNDISAGLEQAWKKPDITGDRLAMLQYTSGSTSSPKGVMLSHNNLMHDLAAISYSFQLNPQDVGVSWLPGYHDMGLMGGVLAPIYSGRPAILISPTAFLQNPAVWLHTISNCRGTISGAPNFAFDLCVRKISPEQRSSLDLSSWRIAFCGAEPVRKDTLDRFEESFSACGFRREAFYPCYGLAENTVFASGGLGPAPPKIYAVNKTALEQNVVIAVPANEPDAKIVVGCGQAPLDQNIVIAHPENMTRCPPGQVGEIWISGPSVAQGYWNRPKETEQTFRAHLADTGEGPFLRTGDMGFLHDQELFITGRLKDLIIIRGRNYYPQDIELAVAQSHPALQPNGGATFTVEIEEIEEEGLVVVQEIERHFRRNLDSNEAIGNIRHAIAEKFGLQPYAVVLVRPLGIPRTSSGKIRRAACRAKFLAKRLQAIAEWKAILPGRLASEERGLQARPAAPEKRAAEIETWLVQQVSAQLGIPAEEIDVHQPFVYYGLDSVQAVSLTGDLAVWLDRQVSPLLAYDYPTISALAQHLADSRGVLESTSEKIKNRTSHSQEPIAIIGLGCRLPGANGPDAFWRLLRDGIDAITEVPAERWELRALYDPDPTAPGMMNSRWGGFLERIDLFDPQFFGISPREAERMDPQQRLLLEVAWEALEDAGQVPERLVKSRTGVFIGISSNDYGQIQLADPALGDPYIGTGNALSMAANRLSYVFGWRGPSIAIDTACSSSLVAVHLACGSLQSGESHLALAGGVNVILSPALTVNFSKAGFMAPDGRCKVFDARANGYVRGEGAGIIVLKLLSQALADGDPIYGVIRGSAVNQDGRTNGLTAPSQRAQEEVLRTAYRRAAISPGQVQYVEAHGTGTALGDPIEAAALGNVLGDGRPVGNKCAVGSVKTNIGHLEAAAGIAGLIKVALSLKHRTIPPSLHFQEPNPYIPFDQLPLYVQQELGPWLKSAGPALAGVSSFGFGGTNAHVVITEAPQSFKTVQTGQDLAAPRAQLLPLSARNPQALEAMAHSVKNFLEEASLSAHLPDICYSAGVRRSHYDYRLAISGQSLEELGRQLDTFVQGELPPGVSSGRKPAARQRKLAFVFSGEGSEWVGMGRELLEQEPDFRAGLERCDEALPRDGGWSLLEILNADGRPPLFSQFELRCSVLLAMQVGLATLWRSWGIEPDVLVGFGTGQVTAAHLAGAVSLPEALSGLGSYGPLSKRVRDQESVAIFGLSAEEIQDPIADYGDDLSLIEQNGSRPMLTGSKASIIRILVKYGYDIFLEISPHPILLTSIRRVLDQIGQAGTLLPSMNRQVDERRSMLTSLGRLYTLGYDVNWDKLHPGGGQYVRLPTYPWQRKRYWLATEKIDRGRHEVQVRREQKEEAGSNETHHCDPLEATGSDHLAGWLYELEWHPKTFSPEQENSADDEPTGRKSWLILADTTGIGEALAALLETRGEWWALVYPGELYESLDRQHFRINPDRPEDFQTVLETAQSGKSSGWHGIVHLWSLDAATPEQITVEALRRAEILGCRSVIYLLQELDRVDWYGQPRLWLVTRGAQAVQQPTPLSVAQAPLWGLGRVLATEHPASWGGLVDLDPQATVDDTVSPLQQQICQPDGEEQVAFRNGQRYVARLVRRRQSATREPPLRWRPDGSYLITGGLGDLGLTVARWMVQQGARRLILLGRTQLPPRRQWHLVEAGSALSRKIRAIRELEALGISVHLRWVDVADEVQLSSFLQEFREEGWPAIRGVVHAAGLQDGQMLLQLDAASLNAVFRPKVIGSWLLHRQLEDDPLDFFILFSSAAALLGPPGQGNYAAANAFMDALAHHRRAHGVPALSINWGIWTKLGFAATSDGQRLASYLERMGIGSLPPEQALELLDRLLKDEAIQAGVIPIDWRQWRHFDPAAGQLTLLSRLVEETAGGEGDGLPEGLSLTCETLLAALPEERGSLLQRYLGRQVARVLGLSSAGLDHQIPLNQLGVDSLMALELKNRVERDLKLAVPVGQFLQGASIDQLVTWLIDRLTTAEVAAPPARRPAAVTRIKAKQQEKSANTLEPLNQSRAKRLLARLDQLTDEEVDLLLNEILASNSTYE